MATKDCYRCGGELSPEHHWVKIHKSCLQDATDARQEGYRAGVRASFDALMALPADPVRAVDLHAIRALSPGGVEAPPSTSGEE